MLGLLSALTCPRVQEPKRTGPGTEGEVLQLNRCLRAAYLGTAYRTVAEAEPAAAEQDNQAVGTVGTSDLWIKNLFS